ncbi:hypothetical protein CesoFtcFv8_024585 [Champsocephalus esox]|uniref:Uncharacterized protein n=1 Tax=Champsocephalus esox TaxID=159716 RepID=A0AAN8GIP6_9TELE|nr:hypothetical protein CesoFtcFv8_024585 [Champsocephalus esox]
MSAGTRPGSTPGLLPSDSGFTGAGVSAQSPGQVNKLINEEEMCVASEQNQQLHQPPSALTRPAGTEQHVSPVTSCGH